MSYQDSRTTNGAIPSLRLLASQSDVEQRVSGLPSWLAPGLRAPWTASSSSLPTHTRVCARGRGMQLHFQEMLSGKTFNVINVSGRREKVPMSPPPLRVLSLNSYFSEPIAPFIKSRHTEYTWPCCPWGNRHRP